MYEMWAKILLLSYVQSISFSIISRARNRNSLKYHVIAASASNTIWYLTFRELVMNKMDWMMFLPYTIGTVAGSVTGAKVSMWIERLLAASSDEHLKRTTKYVALMPLVEPGSEPLPIVLLGPFKDRQAAIDHLQCDPNLNGNHNYVLIDGEKLHLSTAA